MSFACLRWSCSLVLMGWLTLQYRTWQARSLSDMHGGTHTTLARLAGRGRGTSHSLEGAAQHLVGSLDDEAVLSTSARGLSQATGKCQRTRSLHNTRPARWTAERFRNALAGKLRPLLPMSTQDTTEYHATNDGERQAFILTPNQTNKPVSAFT